MGGGCGSGTLGDHMTVIRPATAELPAWLPKSAMLYLRHVEAGQSIREIARAEGCHPSTILRRVRRIEARRDDPLIDEALTRFGDGGPHASQGGARGRASQIGDQEGVDAMSAINRQKVTKTNEELLGQEARRVLRRLAEPSAILVVAQDLEKAVVLKGKLRMAVLEREVAQAFALKDWITMTRSGRVASYEISAAGRAALKRFLEEDAGAQAGFAEDQAGFQPFAAQHRFMGEREFHEVEGPRRVRMNLAESPLGVLARRRDKDGEPFWTQDLVEVGERLREDFELAQMGPRVAQNWERFMTGGDRGGFNPDRAGGGGSERARDRVALALRDLGPGLGDMVLRCCCFLEGLEAVEKRLGWSARSGKIVLRIALMRLKRHYEDLYGGSSPMIG